jgi:hypothetical protein
MKIRLIDDWRKAHRLWSVRLAAIMSALLGVLAAMPDALPALINQLPPEIRAVLPVPVVLLSFALPTLIRLWKQEAKDGAAK